MRENPLSRVPGPDGLALRARIRALARAGTLPLALAIGWIALESWPHPFAWLGLVGFGACLAFCLLCRGTRARAVWFNLGFVFLVPGLFELWLGRDLDRRRSDPSASARMVRDEVFGYGLPAGVSVPDRFFMDDELVFDVVYTIEPNGLRLAPPATPGPDSRCIVFFGGSFSFGMGLPDEETSPYLTGLLSGERHRIYNVSLNGWGPHQMLAGLETGHVASLLECTPTHVIYHSVHDHVRRAAGASHDSHGPRFVLDRAGGVRRAGHFDDDGGPFALRWPRLGRSHLLRRWVESFHAGPRDFELFHGIVAASRDYVEQHWPGAEFHVLLWNKPWKNDPVYWEGLERRGIRVHPISEILPNYPEDRERYGIPNDGHPNRLANGHIARSVVREILHQTPVPAS
jgi:hypothetical protein